jgi:hypothetical protein
MQIKAGQIWASKTNSTTLKVEGVLFRTKSNKEVSVTVHNAKGQPIASRYVSQLALSRSYTLVSN